MSPSWAISSALQDVLRSHHLDNVGRLSDVFADNVKRNIYSLAADDSGFLPNLDILGVDMLMVSLRDRKGTCVLSGTGQRGSRKT